MIDVHGYDRRHALSSSELHHMQLLVARAQQGSKGWHKEARPALKRLLYPLEDVLDPGPTHLLSYMRGRYEAMR